MILQGLNGQKLITQGYSVAAVVSAVAAMTVKAVARVLTVFAVKRG